MDNNIAEKTSKRDYGAIAIYILFFALLVFTISQKVYYHPNEYCAYIIANKYIQAIPTPSGDSGYIFQGPSAGATTVTTFCSVDKGHAFNLARAWHNMAYNESHPPIHGVLLHFTSSFTPGVFSKWHGGVINIFFMLLILFVVRKLIRVFTDDKFVLTAISLVIACSSALLNASAFFRMYVIAMFWVTLNTYIFVRQAGKPVTSKFCAQAFAVTFLGAMSHYYCAFYAVLLSAVYGVQLIRDKEYKGLFKFSGCQLLSAVTLFIIYPRVLFHLTHGRAAESAANATGLADLVSRLIRCTGIINHELFGGMLPVVLLAIIVLFIYARKDKTAIAENQDTDSCININARRYSLIFIPAFIYFLVVSKTAHIQTVDFFQEGFSRYLHPIYAVTLCGLLTPLFISLKKYVKENISKISIAVISVLVVLGSFHYTNWKMDFLYRGYMENQTYRDAYANANCICFTGIGINFCEALEFDGYRSLTWLPLNFDYTRLKNVDFGSQLVICIQSPGVNTDIYMSKILPNLSGYNITYRVPLFLYWGGKGTVYYLDRR